MGDKLTDRQLALLCDLHVLQEAGMIDSGDMLTLNDGRKKTTLEFTGTVTEKGRGAVEAFRSSNRKLIL